MADKRRDPRLGIHIGCSLRGGTAQSTSNVSRRGMLLEGPVVAHAGEDIRVEVDIGSRLSLEGRVRHVTSGAVGVEFQTADERWVQWVVQQGCEEREAPRRTRRLLVWLSVDEGEVGLLTADISVCGAFLLTREDLTPGTGLDLILVDDDNFMLKLRGEVVRAGGADSPGVGIRFDSLERETRTRLEAMLAAA